MSQTRVRKGSRIDGAKYSDTQSDWAYQLKDVGVTLSSAEGPLEILRDVNLEARPGEVIAIVGRSGTGKTTLLRVLGGLLRPTSGSVSVHGRPVDGPPERVVTVFQDYANALLPWRSVRRNVELPLERHVSRAERRDRVDAALEQVGLLDKAADFPWRLSGGMQQRVQIARALVVRPNVLLMDEPFGALDAMTRSHLQDELLRLQKETEATIIFITHDLDEAIYISTQVLVIAGNSPGTIVTRFDTDLPQPRDQITTRELPRYAELRHRVGEALEVNK